MLKHCHPFTWLSLALFMGGTAFALTGDPILMPVSFALAQAAALAEFKKYTSRFQFIMIVLSALGLGLSIDLQVGMRGEATIALTLSAAAIVLRQAFMTRFTYVNLLWVEPALLLVAGALLLRLWLWSPFAWTSHLLPLATFSGACFLAVSYLQDAVMIKRRTRKGYRVQVGQPAADFILPDQQGSSVRLSDHKGRHPVLLIFVRGDWCPGCHMMLRTYERDHTRFRSRGVHVIAIGPDAIDVNKDMVERIGVSYQLLSDSDQQVSQQYGVVYSNPAIELAVDYAEGIPLPASFLIDASGIVRYVSRPDRVGEFLDPALIFKVLDQLPEERGATGIAA